MNNERLKNFTYNTTTKAWSWSAKGGGFGVFGYYTKAKGYPNSVDKDKNSSLTNETELQTANFMYNQQVYWNNELTNDYVTKWEYTPIKYWPNEVALNAVDDQEDDKSTDQATTKNENGGIVSFFAYAPYVSLSSDLSGDGIIKINDSEKLSATNVGNQKAGNPTITYKLNTKGNNVDLLWGTKGNTDYNVLNQGQAQEYVKNGDDLGEASVNVNLSKQTTNGVIDFRFKHALAKIGGTTSPFDKANKNGLMVVLDIDDFKGAETGGQIETDGTHTLTKVTINSITISNDINGDRKINDSSLDKNPGKNDEMNNYTGTLDLATGVWSFIDGTKLEAGSTNVISHVVDKAGTSGGKLKATLDDKTYDSDNETAGIQKDANWFTTANAAHTGSPGVTTVPQNVYEEEVAPFVLFPSTGATKLRFTIDYMVRTYDANLKAGYSEVQQVINKIVTFPSLDMNKHYSILMHLGLTSVKFTATVSDWESETNDDKDKDGKLDLEQEDVYLPINVSGLFATIASEAKSTDTELAISDVFYYEKDVRKTVSDATKVTLEGTATGELSITVADGKVKFAANTTYKDKTATFRLKYEDGGVKIYSDYITVTQKGRTAETAVVTWSTAPSLSTEKAAAGADVTYAVSKVEVAAKESDGTEVSTKPTLSAYALQFIDNTTNTKASWISVETDKFVVAKNTTGAQRVATLHVYDTDNKLLLKVNDVTLTQKAND